MKVSTCGYDIIRYYFYSTVNFLTLGFWSTINFVFKNKFVHDNYQQFIILSQPRSGSNLLASLLDSHHHCVVFGDFYTVSDYMNDIDWGLWKKRGLRIYPRWAPVLKLKIKTPSLFLRKYVFNRKRSHVKSVGFKVMCDQNLVRNKEFRSYLHKNTNLKVVILERSNFLEKYVSFISAGQTGVWINMRRQEMKDQPVYVNLEEWKNFYIQEKKYYDYALELFKKHQTITIHYNDLASDSCAVVDKVLDFLGLPRQECKSALRKQGHLDLRHKIINYEQLVVSFRNTPCEPFLLGSIKDDFVD